MEVKDRFSCKASPCFAYSQVFVIQGNVDLHLRVVSPDWVLSITKHIQDTYLLRQNRRRPFVVSRSTYRGDYFN